MADEEMNGAAGRWSPDNLREFMRVMLDERDKRVNQRFEDFSESVEIRFAAQREAVTTAMQASDKAVAAGLAAADRAVTTAMAAADRAVAKAETATEKRFDAVNEFRATLADQQRTLMPRSEAELMINSVEAKVDVLSTSVTTLQGGKLGMAQGWGFAVGAVGIISVILAVIAMLFNRG